MAIVRRAPERDWRWPPKGLLSRRLTPVALGGAAFLLAQALVNLSNLVFRAVMSQLLGPDSYGVLGSLLVITAALSVPVTTFETLVVARVTRQLDAGEIPDGGVGTRIAIVAGAAVAVVLAAAAPALHSYLHLSGWMPLLGVALAPIPMFATIMPWGLLCGQRKFASAGVAALTGALLRIGFGTVAVWAGFGLTGAVFASVFGDVVRAGALSVMARRARDRRLTGTPAAKVTASTVPTRQALLGMAGFGGLWILVGIDAAFARHYFTAETAGQYVAATTAAAAAFFAPQAIGMIAIPVFSAPDAKTARRTLRTAVTAVAGIGCAIAVALATLGSRLLPIAFGSGYRFPGLLMLVLGLCGTQSALLWVLVQYRLARGGRPLLSGWIGLATSAAAVSLWHGNPEQLAIVMAGSLALAVASALLPIVLDARPDTRPGMFASPFVAASAVDLDVSVVVPFYNPGEHLRPNVLNLIEALRQAQVSFEVITVSDGCTDGSPQTIADLDPGVVRQLALPHNSGKGAALRLGLREGRGRYLGFIDADGDLEPALWQPFLTLVRLYRPDVVIGSKRHPLSDVDFESSPVRRITSWGYQALVMLLFPRLRVRDTQVGIKVFRRELLADVLPRTVETGFVFDLELLAVARRLGYRRIMAAPVTLRRHGVSTIRPATVWHMLMDTCALAWRLHVRRRYDQSRSLQSVTEMRRPPVFVADKLVERGAADVGVAVTGAA